MKRSHLFLVAAAVIALVGFLVWKLSLREAVEPMALAPLEAPVRPGAKSNALTDVPVDAPQREEASARVDPARETSKPKVEGTTLRIHVRLEGLAHRPENFELNVVDPLGSEHRAQQQSELEFSASGLGAGAYIVVWTADGTMTVGQNVEIAPHADEQEVEVVVRAVQRLLVRWTGVSRSLEDELAALPISSDRSVTLSVHATLQAPNPGGLPIEDMEVAHLERKYNLHARPGETNVVGNPDAASSSLRLQQNEWNPPLSPNDPLFQPGAFGYLRLAEPLPLFVSIAFEGRILETRSIAADATDCEFHSSLEDVPDVRNSLSLCVVDDETRAPVRAATVRTIGRGAEWWSLDDSGCLVDMPTRANWRDLEIRHPDYAPLLLHVKTQPGVPTKLAEVRLSKRRPIEVHVVDARGAAVSGASVNAYSLDYFHASNKLTACDVGVWTDKDGNARIEHVGHGQYVILASTTDQLCMPRFVDTRVATSEKIEMIAQPVTAVGIHVEPAPARGTTVCIGSKQTGMPFVVANVSRFGWSNTHLPAGEYKVLLVEDGIASDSVDLVVGGTPFVLEITR